MVPHLLSHGLFKIILLLLKFTCIYFYLTLKTSKVLEYFKIYVVVADAITIWKE